MKESHSESRTWSGTRQIKDVSNNKDNEIKEEKEPNKFKKCLTYLLIAALSILILIFLILILDKSNRSPVFLYFQGIFPSKTMDSEDIISKMSNNTNNQNFIEKNSDSNVGYYKSVLDLYLDGMFATALSKMSLTIPINDDIVRSYQIEAIDYIKNDEMIFHLSLEHELRINNETMILYDKNMNIINQFPTYNESNNTKYREINKDENIQSEMVNNEKKLRKNENKRFLQQEFYNYTSTSEWNHKPQVVNNIIPTYYPRNPYIPPYGNPHYYAPNILVPYVYIY